MSTITFTCYSCNQMLRVGADKAGKKAKCVKCGTILTIPVAAAEEADVVTPGAPPPPAPRRPDNPPPPPRREADLEEEPRRRPRRDDDYEEAPRRPRRDEDDEDRPRRRARDEDDDYEEAPRRRPRDEDDDYDRPRRKWGDWAKVKLGMLLNTIAAGMLIGTGGLLLVAELILLIAVLASGPGGGSGLLRASMILSGISGLLFFLAQIPAVVGHVFDLFAPNKRGALALAITVLSIAAVSLVLKIIWVLIPAIRCFSITGMDAFFGGTVFGFPAFNTGGRAVQIIVTILLIVVIYAEYVVFPLYLRAIATALNDRYLARGTVVPLIMASVVAGLRVVQLTIMASATAGIDPGGGKAIMIVLCLIAMIGSGLLAGYGLTLLRLTTQAQSATG